MRLSRRLRTGREAAAWHITASLHGAAPIKGFRTKRAPKRALARQSRIGEVRGSGFQGRPIVTVCPERLHQHTPPVQVADRDAPVRPVCGLDTGAHQLSGNLLGPDCKAGGDPDVSPSRVKEALGAVCAVKAVAGHSTVLPGRPFRTAF